ncbi:MAG TPA: hypothetical protein IGS52_12785 [Oscillatoriaceae cyanobacterium M33_DOE_052]|uniref:Uncharacterized protein n=1 Tax=Planktothricoides sp. SpSt-374 TaxID=2282167 RepID=A0A7C3ZLD0_9CYAN|nr:hypothetical protein [Oscillatoriaceae cyanobacterium M33_DOE_052]
MTGAKGAHGGGNPIGNNIPSRKYIIATSILGALALSPTPTLANPAPLAESIPPSGEPSITANDHRASGAAALRLPNTSPAPTEPNWQRFPDFGQLPGATPNVFTTITKSTDPGTKTIFHPSLFILEGLAITEAAESSNTPGGLKNQYHPSIFNLYGRENSSQIASSPNIPHLATPAGVEERLSSAFSVASAAIVGAAETSPLEISQTGESMDKAEEEKLREQLLIAPLPVTLTPSTLGAAASPGSSSGSPTAFGASLGQVFAGASYQERTRFTETSDGSISAGFGLGDARKYAGLEVAVSVLDLSSRNNDDKAFDRGSFSFKLHRALPNNWAVALGYENAIVWGFTDAGSSVYGVVSKIIPFKNSPAEPFSSLTVSAGIGNGRFRSEDDFNRDEGTVNFFGSAGLRIIEQASVIADWTGQDLTLGASIVPFRNLPIVITPAVADITGSAGDGARFILGVGYSRSFSF